MRRKIKTVMEQMNAEKPDDVLADLEAKHGSQQRMVSRPVCTDCSHCMQPKKILPRWLWPDEPTAWCCAGMRLAGNKEWNPDEGLPCWKMRTEGACGVDAILFEARTANERTEAQPPENQKR